MVKKIKINEEVVVNSLSFKEIENRCDIQQIVLGISADTSLAVTGWDEAIKIPFSYHQYSVGNNLVFNSSNHSVDIGDNINYVEISAFLQTVGGTGQIFVEARKNNSVLFEELLVLSGKQWDGVTLPEIIFPVVKGDKITLTIRGTQTTYKIRRGQTRLIVKKVG